MVSSSESDQDQLDLAEIDSLLVKNRLFRRRRQGTHMPILEIATFINNFSGPTYSTR